MDETSEAPHQSHSTLSFKLTGQRPHSTSPSVSSENNEMSQVAPRVSNLELPFSRYPYGTNYGVGSNVVHTNRREWAISSRMPVREVSEHRTVDNSTTNKIFYHSVFSGLFAVLFTVVSIMLRSSFFLIWSYVGSLILTSLSGLFLSLRFSKHERRYPLNLFITALFSFLGIILTIPFFFSSCFSALDVDSLGMPYRGLSLKDAAVGEGLQAVGLEEFGVASIFGQISELNNEVENYLGDKRKTASKQKYFGSNELKQEILSSSKIADDIWKLETTGAHQMAQEKSYQNGADSIILPTVQKRKFLYDVTEEGVTAHVRDEIFFRPKPCNGEEDNVLEMDSYSTPENSESPSSNNKVEEVLNHISRLLSGSGVTSLAKAATSNTLGLENATSPLSPVVTKSLSTYHKISQTKKTPGTSVFLVFFTITCATVSLLLVPFVLLPFLTTCISLFNEMGESFDMERGLDNQKSIHMRTMASRDEDYEYSDLAEDENFVQSHSLDNNSFAGDRDNLQNSPVLTRTPATAVESQQKMLYESISSYKNTDISEEIRAMGKLTSLEASSKLIKTDQGVYEGSANYISALSGGKYLNKYDSVQYADSAEPLGSKFSLGIKGLVQSARGVINKDQLAVFRGKNWKGGKQSYMRLHSVDKEKDTLGDTVDMTPTTGISRRLVDTPTLGEYGETPSGMGAEQESVEAAEERILWHEAEDTDYGGEGGLEGTGSIGGVI